MPNRTPDDLLRYTADVVAAHLARSAVPIDQLPQLIQQVYQAMSRSGGTQAGPADRPAPAVPIKKSVTPDYIVCLEDGRKLKILKRHLKTAFDMTPEQYRERWGLAADYPMVAPNYARRRSQLAKQIGLGKQPRRRRRGG